MRISGNKVRNVIYVTPDFTDIDGIDRYGRIVYDVSYWANIPKAIKNDSVLVRISVYANNPITTSSLFEGVTSARLAIHRLKEYETTLKNQIRSARANPIAVKVSDISSNISNEIAKKIKRNPEHAEMYLGLQRQIVAVPTADIVDNSATEIANTTVSKVSTTQVSKDRSMRRAALKSILSSGVDPSAVGEASFPINTAMASIQGLNRHGPSGRNYRVHRAKRGVSSWRYGNRISMTQGQGNKRIKSSSWGKYLRARLRRQAYKDGSTLSMLPSKTQVRTRMVSKSWAEITEEIRLPSDRIKGLNKLHFLIELINSDGDAIDVKHRIVDHDAEIEEFLTPDYAPRIYARAHKPGINLLYLRQTDKVGTEIYIYRKILNPTSPYTSKKYVLIRKVLQTRRDRGRRVIDWAPNSSTCIYRAIAVGPRNRISHKFRNAIAKPYKHKVLSTLSAEELTHVSIFAQTQGDHVIVRVTNIPEGPCALYVIADDLSSRPEERRFNDSTRIVGSEADDQVYPVEQVTTDITFEDTAVQPGHIYEYRCVMIYPDGKEVLSKITEVHEFLKELGQEEKVVVELADLTLQTDAAGGSTVSFNINPSFTSTGMETVVNALSASGVSASFITEVQADRSKLNNLLAFLVQRQAEVSGETETFGVISAGSFTDNAMARRVAGVQPLLAGSSYRYIVKVLMRSAESLFDTVLSEDIDLETAKRYQTKVSKFLNPTTLRNGTLPSTGQAFGKNPRSRMKSTDKFMEGRTGLETTIDVDIIMHKASIDKVRAIRHGARKSFVYWSITGSQDDIDHFIVMATYQGVKSTVGTVHNMSYSGRYFFIDKELSYEPGTIEYSVIPVFADYQYGDEMFAEEVTLNIQEPEFTVST